MLITNTNSLKEYFKAYKGTLGINEVAFGDYDRILARLTKADFKYPVLWVERPEIQYLEDGGSQKRFKFAITILKNTNNLTTYEAEDLILEQCEQKMDDILHQIEADSGNDTFQFDKTNTRIDTFERISPDMSIGCRAEIEIIGGILC